MKISRWARRFLRKVGKKILVGFSQKACSKFERIFSFIAPEWLWCWENSRMLSNLTPFMISNCCDRKPHCRIVGLLWALTERVLLIKFPPHLQVSISSTALRLAKSNFMKRDEMWFIMRSGNTKRSPRQGFFFSNDASHRIHRHKTLFNFANCRSPNILVAAGKSGGGGVCAELLYHLRSFRRQFAFMSQS